MKSGKRKRSSAETAKAPGRAIGGPASAASSLIQDAVRSGLAGLLAVFFGLIAVFGIVVWILERRAAAGMFKSALDGLYWAVVTLGTVGYGDKYPSGVPAKLVTMLFIIGGVIVTSLVSGTIASLFVERRIREGKGLQDVRLKGHAVVCGWNGHAEAVLAGLASEAPGRPVVLVSGLEPERFDAIKAAHPGMDLRFVRGDHTMEAILRKAAVQQAESVILLPDETGASGAANADERTILAALAVKSISGEPTVRAAVLKADSEPHLKRAQVDDVVVHGEFTGFLLSASGGDGGLPGAARELLSFSSPTRLRQVELPQSLVGMSFAEASSWFIQSGRGVLVGLLSKEKPVTLDDILSSSSGAIDEFIKRKFAEASVELGSDGLGSGKARLSPPADYLIGDTDVGFVVGGADA